MEINVRVKTRGPLLNASAYKIIDDFLEEAVDNVADAGKAEIDRVLPGVLRNPTGYYQSQIDIDPDGSDRIINDSGVIYGPWLEGVGSRNKTTRFKGYFTFRKTKQWLKGRAKTIAQTTLPPYLRRLGGK